MAIIRPFKALRPVKEAADKVASVPYDVVNRGEAAEFAMGNPLSYLNITRAEIEFEAGIDPYSPSVYQRAKENLDRIKKEAPLLIDENPHFYIYKLVMGEQEQIGIAATFSVDDYENDVIRKHEKTRKDKEDDRTNHIVTTNAQTGPVFLTYKGVPEINSAISKAMSDNTPLYDFTAPDGIKHTIWILPGEYNNIIISGIAKVKNLYIADGHHRAASAARARKVKQEHNHYHTGDEEYNFFLAVLFPAEQLKILPYNRVIRDLNGLDKDRFFSELKRNFKMSVSGSREPDKARTFTMYYDKTWYKLETNENMKNTGKVADDLDVSLLQNYLLEPVLGIDDPRTNKRIDFVGGIRGTAELEKLVDSGKAAVAFSLHPVSVSDLMRISDAGEIMPPKSTWFEPKLRDGLLVHLI